MTRSAADLLAAARSGLVRLTPAEALAAMGEGGVLVDIRPEGRRESQGEIRGSWIVPRNVLEWRFADDEGARGPRLPSATAGRSCSATRATSRASWRATCSGSGSRARPT